MNGRQKATLKAVFTEPTLANIEWAAIESLLKALDCEVKQGKGSRVTFILNRVVVGFHRPHPAKEAKFYQVEDARAFLTKIGVTPE